MIRVRVQGLQSSGEVSRANRAGGDRRGDCQFGHVELAHDSPRTISFRRLGHTSKGNECGLRTSGKDKGMKGGRLDFFLLWKMHPMTLSECWWSFEVDLPPRPPREKRACRHWNVTVKRIIRSNANKPECSQPKHVVSSNVMAAPFASFL